MFPFHDGGPPLIVLRDFYSTIHSQEGDHRLLHLTYLARVTPDASCEVVFQTHEWQALHAFTYQTNVLPTLPPSLHEATHLVAKLDGFPARKSDGEPGVQTIWRGLRRLDDLASMWLLFHSPPSQAAFQSCG
ncbi:MAG TPA: IS4 family transposase [Ktedonobacteraceae bacterium]